MLGAIYLIHNRYSCWDVEKALIHFFSFPYGCSGIIRLNKHVEVCVATSKIFLRPTHQLEVQDRH